MTCAGCETAVKMVLRKTPGVTSANVSYEDKRAVVSYDATKTTPAKIAAAVADALSYKVSVGGATAVPVAKTLGLKGDACEMCTKSPLIESSYWKRATDRIRGPEDQEVSRAGPGRAAKTDQKKRNQDNLPFAVSIGLAHSFCDTLW